MELKQFDYLMETISLNACMIEDGDLRLMGELLNAVEELHEGLEGTVDSCLQDAVQGFKQHLCKQILDEKIDSASIEKGVLEIQTVWRDIARGRKPSENMNAVLKQLEEDTEGSNTDSGILADWHLSDEDRRIFEEFIFESRDNLDAVERTLVEQEQNPGNPAGIHAIFRTIHTIKGVSGAIELPEINVLCHHIENLVERVRDGILSISDNITDVILSSVDTLKLMIDELEQSLGRNTAVSFENFSVTRLIEKIQTAASSPAPKKPALVDNGQIIPKKLSEEDAEITRDFYVEAREHLENIELKLIELEENPEDAEIIDAIFRPFHTIKGVAGFLELSEINTLCHHTENLIDRARAGEITIDNEIANLILETVDTLKILLDRVEEGVELGITASYDDIDVDRLIEKTKNIGEASESVLPIGKILVENGSINDDELCECLAHQKNSPGKKLGEILVRKKKVESKDIRNALQIQKKKKTAVALQVKVDTEKLDNLVDLAGELVIAQSMFKKIGLEVARSNQKYFQQLNQVTQAVSGIQKIAMSMRMVPVKNTFQKMIRLVRDLSRNSGKEVELTMAGEDTEIDRNVVDELYEPMVHMIRNSVDHGLEPPAERESAGKKRKGSIHLRAFQKAGNIVIEIKDDGRGLDKTTILNKALERGLVQKTDVLTHKEIYGFIMKPGFSTAQKVTDISGRGVGMDVVKKAIEKLRGKLDIDSTPNQGTVFTISLPLTLAIVDGMLVRVGGEKYIIPTHAIIESFKPDRESCHTVKKRGEMVNHREGVISVIRISRLFGSPDSSGNPWEGIVVVAESDGVKRALLVDELLGKDEFVIKSLGETFQDIKGLAGSAILSDGRVGLILDLPGLFQFALETH